jgi:hypothetical protein
MPLAARTIAEYLLAFDDHHPASAPLVRLHTCVHIQHARGTRRRAALPPVPFAPLSRGNLKSDSVGDSCGCAADTVYLVVLKTEW